MKATLEFNLEDPDERIEHLRCLKALDMALFIWDLNKLHTNSQDNPNLNEDTVIMVDALFDKIYYLMDEHGINLDELLR